MFVMAMILYWYVISTWLLMLELIVLIKLIGRKR